MFAILNKHVYFERPEIINDYIYYLKVTLEYCNRFIKAISAFDYLIRNKEALTMDKMQKFDTKISIRINFFKL